MGEREGADDRMAEERREGRSRGEDGESFSSHFPFTPPPLLSSRHTQISLRTIISQLIFNVTDQSQILILHFLLTALTIPQSLILLASMHFLFISLSVYLVPPLSLSPSKYTLFLSHPHLLCFSLSLLAGSLKTSLSREEGKVLFCLISLLSPVWRKHS